MNPEHLRSLIVDDEDSVRRLTTRALTDEAFRCDSTADGAEAIQLAMETAYDVVVTDLCMPNRHGHALAVELLLQRPRPAIVILTAIMEPRIVKDLISRGVNDVAFKPVDYRTFAAKVKALVECQMNRKTDELAPLVQHGEPDQANHTEACGEEPNTPISLSEIESSLAILSRALPISKTALEIFYLARSEHSNPKQLAATVELDASLSDEVLRSANSSFYNPSGELIIDLNAAVTRIGTKRFGVRDCRYERASDGS